MSAVLLVANAACAWFLAGLIWTIQLVHYPLFSRAGRDGFAAYESAHSRMITPLVGPVMLAELALALALVAMRPRAVPAWAAWTLLALVGAVWLSTFALQVPAHGILARGFDAEAHARLVATNWIRTAAWTARAAILAWLLAQALGAKDAPSA
jgi:hypothetical protein